MILMNKTILQILIPISTNARFYSHAQIKQSVLETCPSYFSLCKEFGSNERLAEELINSMAVHNDFLSPEDEQSIIDEIDPYMKKLRYEFDHWDDAIHGYRETERLKWNEKNNKILDRVRSLAFPENVSPLKFVHILDLDKKGYIKPHIDAVRGLQTITEIREGICDEGAPEKLDGEDFEESNSCGELNHGTLTFCGDTITGLSLLTDSIMRLVHEKQKHLYADILLKRRSLYIMKGTARFDYTHEILSNEHSVFKGEKILKDRRISVICRNEPDPKYKDA